MPRSASGRLDLDARDISQQFVQNEKTGNFYTASMHVICAVVGIGVLALPQAIAYLGWIAGPLCIAFFWLTTWLSSVLLASLYLVDGKMYSGYYHMVNDVMSKKQGIFLSSIQVLNLLLIMMAYAITGGLSVSQIANTACTYEGKTVEEVETTSSCLGLDAGGTWKGILIFGAAEVLISQIRSLEETGWMSAIGAGCSAVYSLVAIIISFASLNPSAGTLGGISTTAANKVFGIFNAIGTMATSFTVSVVQMEIQDTLRQPPSPITQMKKTMSFSIFVSFVLYMLVGCSGYGSQGNEVASIILDSFESPRWALLLAYCALLLHMLTAFQIFAQAFFDMVESHIKAYLLRREQKKSGMNHQPLDDIVEEGEQNDKNKSIRRRRSEMKVNQSCSLVEKRFSHEIVHQRKLFQYSRACLEDRVHDRLQTGNSSFIHQSLASYGLHSGFAQEEVPFNSDGVYLPFGYRLVVRTAIVLLVLLICCIMPFFSAFVGLIGAVSYFPLAIHFPFRCYQKIYHTTRPFDVFLEIFYWLFAFITSVSIVGSVRSIIVGWSTYKIFG